MSSYGPLVCTWLALLSIAHAELNVPAKLINEGTLGGPGVKARLSRKGIQYVSEVMSASLMTEVVNSNINLSAQAVKVGNKVFTVSDMNLKRHASDPKIETDILLPDVILVTVSNINASSEANVTDESDGSSIALTIRSEATTLKLKIAPVKTIQGAPNMKVKSCEMSSPSVSATLNPAPEPSVQVVFDNEVKGLLAGLICARLEFVMEDRVNERFGLLTPKITLAHINDDDLIKDLAERIKSRRQRRQNPWNNLGVGMNLPMGFNLGAGLGRKKRTVGMRSEDGMGRKRRDAAVISSFNVSHMDALFLDYTILSEPRLTSLGLEVESSGEVSLRGRGGTPFGPVPCPLPETVHEDFMLQMIVSDFMPNSLMYHGHTIGLFKTKVDPSTPHFGAIMKTTCSLSSGTLFCLGDLFPTLRKVHPDRKLALIFNTLQAPVIMFRPASSGGINFSLIGRIAIMVIHPQTKAEETVAEMKIVVDAQMKMRLSSSMVRPKIQLDHIKLTTLSPGILLQNELDDAVMLAREVLQRMVNDLLKDGIPIPVHPLFKLVRPKVKVVERALLLQTNVELNERLLRQLTAGDLLRRRRF